MAPYIDTAISPYGHIKLYVLVGEKVKEGILTSAHTDVGGLAARLEEKEKERGHPFGVNLST